MSIETINNLIGCLDKINIQKSQKKEGDSIVLLNIMKDSEKGGVSNGEI